MFGRDHKYIKYVGTNCNFGLETVEKWLWSLSRLNGGNPEYILVIAKYRIFKGDIDEKWTNMSSKVGKYSIGQTWVLE